MQPTDRTTVGWGTVEAFRRERAQRVARMRALQSFRPAHTASRDMMVAPEDPVVVSLAAYRRQLATGTPQRLDYAGALVEWLRLGEGLSPESLEVAVTFMMGWPARITRPGGAVLSYPR